MISIIEGNIVYDSVWGALALLVGAYFVNKDLVKKIKHNFKDNFSFDEYKKLLKS